MDAHPENPFGHVEPSAADAASAAVGGAAEHPARRIDPSFVVPPEHRPSRALSACSDLPADHIPVVDLAPLHSQSAVDAPALESIVAQVGLACAEWGFFQVINHGIPQEIIQSLKDAAKAFFELPLQKKQQVKRTFENPLGYNDGELTKNVRDWKEVFDIAPGGSFQLPANFGGDDDHVLVHPNQWPSFMPSLRYTLGKDHAISVFLN